MEVPGNGLPEEVEHAGFMKILCQAATVGHARAKNNQSVNWSSIRAL